MPLNHAGRLLRADGGSRSFLASDIEYRQELYDRNHGVLRTPRPSARSFSIRSVTSQVCSLGSFAMLLGIAVVCFLSYQMTLGMLTGSALGMNHFIIDALKDQSGTLTKIFQSHSDASATSTEAQAMSQHEQSHVAIYNETYCSPTAVDITQVNDDSAFYVKLRNASLLPPPVFPSSLKLFCADTETARQYQWEYCLPVAADRTDEPQCQHADRLDLQTNQLPGGSFCAASVLHLLLVDAYEVLSLNGAKPSLLDPTLARNGSIALIATTAELGFRSHLVATDVLRHELNARGYHLFYESVWRVCVAPTHPLASKMYRDAQQQQPTANASTLHVDLLRMEPMAAETGGSQWFVESVLGRRMVQKDALLPYQKTRINGVLFDTIADPTAFLNIPS